MPLQKQTAHVPLAAGVETKAHQHHIELPKLATAHNVSWPEPGAISKRLGFEALDGAPTMPTRTLLTSGSDNTAKNSPAPYTTASITPTGNRLVLAFVMIQDDANDPTIVTASGCSLTWVEIGNVSFFSSRARLYVFRALGASPTTGTVLFVTGSNAECCSWSIEEWANVDTSGTNGSGAVADIQTASGVSLGTISVSLSSLPAFDAVSGGVGLVAGLTTTLETDWDTTASQTADDGAGNVAKLVVGRKADSGDPTFTATVAGANFPYAAAAVQIQPADRLGIRTTTGSSLTAPVGLVTRGNELVTLDSSNLMTWTDGPQAWKDLGFDFDPVRVSSRVVAARPGEQYFGDRARFVSGDDAVDLFTWYEFNNSGQDPINYQLVDVATEAVLASGTVAGVRPRALVVGNYLQLWRVDTTSLKVTSFDAAALLSSRGATLTTATVTVLTTTGSTVPYAVKNGGTISGPQPSAVAAIRFNATDYKVALVQGNGTVSTTAQKARVANASMPIDVVYDQPHDRYAVIRVDDTNTHTVRADLLDNALADIGGSVDIGLDASSGIWTTLNQITCAFTTKDQGGGVTWARVFWSGEYPTGAGTTNRTIRAAILKSNGTTATLRGPAGSVGSPGFPWAWNMDLASHAFARGTDSVFFVACHQSHINTVGSNLSVPTGYERLGSYNLWRHDGYISADFLRITGSRMHIGGVEDASKHLPGLTLDSSDVARGMMVDRTRAVLESTLLGTPGGYGDRNLVDFEFDFGDSPPPFGPAVEAGGVAYLPNGFYYDGQAVFEQNFLAPPHAPVSVTLGTTGGAANSGLDDNSTYAYTAIWEWTNAQGERERSTWETVWELSTGAGGGPNANDTKATFTIHTTNATHKRNTLGAADYGGVRDLSLAIYRTVKNSGEGAIYYRVTSIDPTTEATTNGYLRNEPFAGAITWADAMTDAVLITKENLYTDSGELDNIPIDYYPIVAQGQDRLFAAGLSNPNKIRYSKLQREGEPVAFNDALVILLPKAGGAITALEVRDSEIVVFKERRLYTVEGTGFSNTGTTGGYNDPQLRDAAVGCIDARSVVQWPGGVLFQSHKGIYNWTGTSASYIGGPVEDYALNEISAAVLLEDQHQVIFFLASPATALHEETGSVSALVYDYLLGNWATWSEPSSPSGVALWDGSLVVVAGNPGVLRIGRQSTTKLDFASTYVDEIETPWVKTAGIQGFGRMWWCGLLGVHQGDHLVRAKFAFDYDPSWVDSKAWTPTQTPYQVRIGPSRTLMTAFKLRLIGEANGHDVLTDSADWSALSLEIGVHGGIMRGGGSRSF